MRLPLILAALLFAAPARADCLCQLTKACNCTDCDCGDRVQVATAAPLPAQGCPDGNCANVPTVSRAPAYVSVPRAVSPSPRLRAPRGGFRLTPFLGRPLLRFATR